MAYELLTISRGNSRTEEEGPAPLGGSRANTRGVEISLVKIEEIVEMTRTRFWIESPCIEEIHLVLCGEQGRTVSVDWPEA